jgi:hypothetical protein
MPTNNFFLSSLLAPACSSYPFQLMTSMLLNCTFLNPSLEPMTYTSINCTIPFSDPSSSIILNCMFSIPVSWITHSSNPPHHLSHIAFIEDTNDTQHKVTCPTSQMYLRDGSHRGPNGPVAYAPACYANNSLESDSAEHYPCSTPLPHHPPCYESYTS